MIITVTPNPGIDLTLTVPRLEHNTVLRAVDVRSDLGGKGFNVSRALQALGAHSIAMGFVGGYTGQQMADGLHAAGIQTDFVRIAAETRTNVVVTDEPATEHLKVNEPGPHIQPEEAASFFKRVRDRVRPGDVWVLSGSLPPGLSADFYARLIELVQAQGARAVLDSSGEPLRLGCQARPFAVKPNDVEAAQITGTSIRTPDDAQRAAAKILDLGIGLVALSLGAAGLLLASHEETVRLHPPRVQAKNAVGAGDALVAGLVWALDQGWALREAGRWAVAAGTASAMRAGVTFGTLDEVRRMMEQVCVD